MGLTAREIVNRFDYHPSTGRVVVAPNGTVGNPHGIVRGMCRDLAVELNELLPDGREKSTAMTKLEEVMFWANAAIARNGEG